MALQIDEKLIEIAYSEVVFEYARQEKFIYLAFDKYKTYINNGIISQDIEEEMKNLIGGIINAYGVSRQVPPDKRPQLLSFLVHDYLPAINNKGLADVWNELENNQKKILEKNTHSLFSKISHFFIPNVVPIYDSIARKTLKCKLKTFPKSFQEEYDVFKAKHHVSIDNYFQMFAELCTNRDSHFFNGFSDIYKAELKSFFFLRIFDKILLNKDEKDTKYFVLELRDFKKLLGPELIGLDTNGISTRMKQDCPAEIRDKIKKLANQTDSFVNLTQKIIRQH